MMYKVHYGLIKISSSVIEEVTINIRFCPSLLIKASSTYHFILPRAIPLWNSVTSDLIDQPLLDDFKNLNDIDFG